MFGIADKVLIQSGKFSFELDKEEMMIPKPQYDHFEGISGSKLVLQMSPQTCQDFFGKIFDVYKDKEALLTQNPILFLNKLTHLKIYMDSFRRLEFNVNRVPKEKVGDLFIEKNVGISIDMEFSTCDRKIDPQSNVINCCRYTMPITYGKEECFSRYGNNVQFDERKHNLVAVIPLDDLEVKTGLLYSFLPTQIKTNIPLFLHVPFKLDVSREFVDPQGYNAWFSKSITYLSEFLKVVYIDLAHNIQNKIVDYIPKSSESIFKIGENEKVACLDHEELKGEIICSQNIFYTAIGNYQPANRVVSFSKDIELADPLAVYQLLGEQRELFIPSTAKNMRPFGIEIIKEVYEKLFENAVGNPEYFEQIMSCLETLKVTEEDYRLLIEQSDSIVLRESELSVVGKYVKFLKEVQSVSANFIHLGKKPPVQVTGETAPIDEKARQEIIKLVQEANLKSVFENYFNQNKDKIFTVKSEADLALLGENGIVLKKGEELNSLAILVEPFDSNKIFSLSLKLRAATKRLDRIEEDDACSNLQYLEHLRDVRKSIKIAYGEKTYQGYVSVIKKIGANPDRFLNELLQNADDCSFSTDIVPSFSLEIQDKLIKTISNEEGFTKANVRAITAIGDSTKKFLQKKDFEPIGEKGVGFKSVFGIADSVEIHSNGFDFEIKATAPTIPAKCSALQHGKGTVMVFKTKEGVGEGLRKKDKNEQLRLCLCLRKLKRISFPGIDIEIKDLPSERQITLIGSNNKKENYALKRFEYNFIVRDEAALKDRRSGGREISRDQKITIYAYINKVPAESFVYSGLPTEIRSDVPLIIDAPFDLTSSREGILENHWNNIIRDEVYQAVFSFIEQEQNLAKGGGRTSIGGLNVLDYVHFESVGGRLQSKNFGNHYLNAYDWSDLLKNFQFIPIVGRENFVSPPGRWSNYPGVYAQVDQ
ncbi:sacsin N-terminal ATP-binding-like domain-containing protein [Peptococcus simiae]|uniref:sacsin N-terminal ATP-binding-like domain-containing protein n=1 Tax=Peptococcus simiae TaxID=1643805 RepID=UPI00397E9BC5